MLKPRWNTKKSPALPLYYKDKPKRRSPLLHLSKLMHRYTPHSSKMRLRTIFVLAVLFVVYYLFRPSSSYRGIKGKYGNIWDKRKLEVKEVFLESWRDYSRHGWGNDIYHPVTQKGSDMGTTPLGWIIVDSLDTLQIMGCKEEFETAKSWVKYELDYSKYDRPINTFETTIRMLGGLLSAYYLSDDELFLEKAVTLGERLLSAFNSPTGIPYSSVNLKTGKNTPAAEGASTAEMSTLQLEFKYLASLTGEQLYWEKVEKAMKAVDMAHPDAGLAPIYIDPIKGKFKSSVIRLGSRGDSYYEYLLKQYLQTGEEVYLEMYKESFEGINKFLVGKSYPSGFTFIGERPNGLSKPLDNKMDHLVCFFGGLFALGATNGVPISKSPVPQDDFKLRQLKLGQELAETCYHMYHDVEPTRLSPEIVVFNTKTSETKDFTIKRADRHNLQRPETVETLYYLYKLTGDMKYREWGYEIFQSFAKWTKVPAGKGKDDNPRYTSLTDVTVDPCILKDNMESFWLAETLKYLYLLFDDTENPKLDLENVVFNTEAHPFPKMDIKGSNFHTGWSREENRVSLNKEREDKQGKNEGEKVGEEKIEKGLKKAEEKIEKGLKEIGKNEGQKIEKNGGVKQKENEKLVDYEDESKLQNGEMEKNKVNVGKLTDSEAKLDTANGASGDNKDESQPVDDRNVELNKKVAEELKQKHQLPQAKHDVAQPLDEQVREVNQKVAAEIPDETDVEQLDRKRNSGLEE